jgi:Phage endonuclease I
MSQNLNFRSGFEGKIYEQAVGENRQLEYEPSDAVLRYTKSCSYLPDWRLPNGILVETKGYFKSSDRTKMLSVAKENPLADIRLVFQRANNTLTKSKRSLTYWQWAEKYNFKWAEGTIPESWWKENKQ